MKLSMLHEARPTIENRYCAHCRETTYHDPIGPGMWICQKCGTKKYSQSMMAQLLKSKPVRPQVVPGAVPEVNA